MKRAPLLLTILGLVLITVLWFFFLIRPRNADIAAAEDRVAAITADRQSLQSQIDSLNRIKDSEVTFIFAIGEMEASVPTNPELDAFIEDVTFLAERSGIDIATLGATVPTAVEGAPGLFEIDLAITAQGEFFEVLGFLFGLEDLERLVKVESLGLIPVTVAADDASSADDPDAPRPRPTLDALEIQLSGKFFTRTGVAVEAPPPPETTTTTAAPGATTTTTDPSATTTTTGGG